MVYIYLPVAYYHLNLDVTKANLLAAGFSAVPAVFLLVLHISPGMMVLIGLMKSSEDILCLTLYVKTVSHWRRSFGYQLGAVDRGKWAKSWE